MLNLVPCFWLQGFGNFNLSVWQSVWITGRDGEEWRTHFVSSFIPSAYKLFKSISVQIFVTHEPLIKWVALQILWLTKVLSSFTLLFRNHPCGHHSRFPHLRPWFRTWANICRSLSDSKRFSPGTPVFLSPWCCAPRWHMARIVEAKRRLFMVRFQSDLVELRCLCSLMRWWVLVFLS